MDFKQLKAFLTVAETGNVTRAAEVLHLVQPAVSRQIRMLEEDIGTPLFERERLGMVLTDAGRKLLEYARRSMLELERARSEIASTSGEVRGLATIGILPSTVDVVSSVLVREVHKKHPGIRLRLAMGYAGTLLKWLENGEIDAALLYGNERSNEIAYTQLLEEPLWVVGPANAKLKANRPVPFRTLEQQAFVLPSASHGLRALVDHACAVTNIELSISAETNALSVQRSLVIGGHGMTILPPIAIADDLRHKTLTAAPVIDPDLKRTIVMALPTNRPIGRHIRCCVEILTDCVTEAVESGRWHGKLCKQ